MKIIYNEDGKIVELIGTGENRSLSETEKEVAKCIFENQEKSLCQCCKERKQEKIIKNSFGQARICRKCFNEFQKSNNNEKGIRSKILKLIHS